MYDCASEIGQYHDDKVTLPKERQKEMRKRRDSNRDRLRSGLEKAEKPEPSAFHKQGSYAMKTMVQDSDKDYDIDDGVYFEKADLQDSNGIDMSAPNARQMVRNALQDDRFNRQPESRDNCVRVYYNEGYHVDVPVYRRSGAGKDELIELASVSWKDADARGVTEWFEAENTRLSPKDTGDGQFRRAVRLLKKFARSRDDWKSKNASGFMITKLASELFVGDKDREDRALRSAMSAIRDRLEKDLVVIHPVVKGDTITKGSSDPKATFLRDKLKENLPHLDVLDRDDCTREQALKAWGKVFNDTWFDDQVDSGGKTGAAAMLSSSKESYEVVNKRGGGRYA